VREQAIALLLSLEALDVKVSPAKLAGIRDDEKIAGRVEDHLEVSPLPDLHPDEHGVLEIG
jgi:hypothetical protein